MPIPFLSEGLALGRIFITVCTGGWRWWRARRRRLTPQETLAIRSKWKPLFVEWLRNQRHQKLSTEVIIRDLRRIDNYPDTKEGKGISAWFRIGLIGNYERGIMLSCGIYELVYDANEEVYYSPAKGARGNTKVTLTGYVPYENIETVDWDGDQYYSYPHIYCYFDRKHKQPYEKLSFCERGNLDEHVFYSEIISFESVRRETKKRGIKSSFLS
ncbi:hypothetical protein [Nitrobacter sp. Nb-311A]|uniref:hypothetical protein n=1 Tax=Nitrobacter sp. Nb-311A TaxID=314253 RepID=UPI000322E197|nr:hypothetical protein [Nitrobacter sp. Nb-311A]